MKNALYIKERNPEAQVHILYRDIQMYGTENERMLWESRGKGVRFDVYDVERPPVVKEDVVQVYQPLVGEMEEIPYDLVVLSTPLVAPEDAPALANLMRTPHRSEQLLHGGTCQAASAGFCDGRDLPLRHGTLSGNGFEAQAQGLGAASRASTVLFKDKLVTSALVSFITEQCDGCALCLDVCPYYALQLEEYEEGDRIHKRVKSR